MRSLSPSPSQSQTIGGGVIPVEEFDTWLESNRQWHAKTKEKVLSKQQTYLSTLQEQANKPRIYAKSLKLAELGTMREVERLREKSEHLNMTGLSAVLATSIVHVEDTSQGRGSGSNSRGNSRGRKRGSFSSAGYNPVNSNNNHDDEEGEREYGEGEGERRGRERSRSQPNRVGGEGSASADGRRRSLSIGSVGSAMGRVAMDVYERLAIRGRIYAEEKKNYQPPTPPKVRPRYNQYNCINILTNVLCQQEFFNPQIHPRSAQLVESRRNKEREFHRSKSVSVSPSRYAGVTSLSQLRRSQSVEPLSSPSIRRNDSASSLHSQGRGTPQGDGSRPSSRQPSRQNSVQSLHSNGGDGDRSVHSHSKSQHRPAPRVVALNLKDLAKQDIEKFRSKSVTRQEEEKKKRYNQEFINDNTVIK